MTPDAESEVDLDAERFSMQYRKPQFPLTIMLPYTDGFRGPVFASMLYYAKHLDCGFELVGNTLIASARNELADRFMRSKALWSFWVDSDVFVPFGNTNAFCAYTGATKGRDFAKYNTITHMLAHDRPLVGGVYAGRFKGAPLTIQPDLYPRSPNDQYMCDAIRNGQPAGGLQAVDWVASGLMLVHRYTFQRIMETQPVELPFPNAYYPFFTQFEHIAGGEDIAFCERAKKAGIQPMLDTDIRAAHIGFTTFLPEDSRSPLAAVRRAVSQPPGQMAG